MDIILAGVYRSTGELTKSLWESETGMGNV